MYPRASAFLGGQPLLRGSCLFRSGFRRPAGSWPTQPGGLPVWQTLAGPFAFLAGCLLCLALSFWLPAYVLSSALAGFDTEQLQSKRCATSNLRSRLLMNGLQQIYHTASANSP